MQMAVIKQKYSTEEIDEEQARSKVEVRRAGARVAL